MKKEIPVCDMCGQTLGFISGDTFYFYSDYIYEPICLSCLVEHCCTTNCLSCEIGTYPECKHLERKLYLMAGD